MSGERVSIICVKCKERVGYIIPEEVDLPLRGDMVHPHIGCENWPLPWSGAGPLEFVCPHAWGEEYDQHLFVDLDLEDASQSREFLTENHTLFTVNSTPCKCGCGGFTKPGNKYANGLKCHHRYERAKTG